jgi:hypothetical protein
VQFNSFEVERKYQPMTKIYMHNEFTVSLIKQKQIPEKSRTHNSADITIPAWIRAENTLLR